MDAQGGETTGASGYKIFGVERKEDEQAADRAADVEESPDANSVTS